MDPLDPLDPVDPLDPLRCSFLVEIETPIEVPRFEAQNHKENVRFSQKLFKNHGKFNIFVVSGLGQALHRRGPSAQANGLGLGPRLRPLAPAGAKQWWGTSPRNAQLYAQTPDTPP